MTDAETPINISRLANNACFGCGHSNEHGFKIRLYPQHRPDAAAQSVSGEFTTHQHQDGFPGITHGGVLYTAMDCTSTWTAYVGKPHIPAVWVLRNADVTYHHPAFAGTRIQLDGRIVEDAEDWQALIIKVVASDDHGESFAEGRFKVIPLPVEKFKALTGITELPGDFAAFLRSFNASHAS